METTANLKPVAGEALQVVHQAESLPIQTVIGNNGQQLADILIGNIKKVQASPGYIPQAKEIASQVREIINLARIEVEMYRISNQVAKRGR